MFALAHRYVRPGFAPTTLPGATGRNQVGGQIGGQVGGDIGREVGIDISDTGWCRLRSFGAPFGRIRFLRVAWLAATAFGVGACGNVTFVDAPFAPRQVDVLYSQQEDVTVVRWHLGAAAPDRAVSFELVDAAGSWQRIDFAASVYPGGVARCGNGKGLCGQMVVPGHYQPPADAPTPIRSRNPTYDVSPGNASTFHDYSETLSLKSYFLRDNSGLAARITDVIGGDAVFVFPRPLERSVWERRGVCIPGYLPSDARFDAVTGLQDPWPAPLALSASGHYCAAVRPVMNSGDRGSDLQIAIDTVPEVASGDHVYTVPTEITPFTYQIVLDLSIPVADLCQQSTQQIPALVARTLGGYSELRPLELTDLSASVDPETGQPGMPCRQSPLRALAERTAQDVKTAAAAWPEQHRRYFLLYFNNLRAPLPNTLTDSFSELSKKIVTPPSTLDFQSLLWPFGPPEMSQSFGGWTLHGTEWESASDPSFADQLLQFASTSLPLISEIQNANQPVEILPSRDQARQLDGGLLRLCEISIAPLQGAGLQLVAHDGNGQLVSLDPATEYAVHAADPPAYLLEVPAVWAVSSVGFSPHQSRIRYEVCTRYCDHPFTSESGVAVTTGWIGNELCVGPPSGGHG